MSRGTWTVSRIEVPDGKSRRFPFLVRIETRSGQLFEFRTSDAWPPPAGSLFALPSSGLVEGEREERLDACDLVDVKVVNGPKASTIEVVLDRGLRRRCNFLVYEKRGTTQAYFRTPEAMHAHKSRSYIQPGSLRVIGEVVIDTRERYGWNLPANQVVRAPLQAGDYALRMEERLVAVVERKSIRNMLGELNTLATYHTHLSELERYPRAALVIEAAYGDFLNPAKTKPMSAERCRKGLADIAALHPNLQIVYAGNRKQAQIWVSSYFEAASAAERGAGDSASSAGAQGALSLETRDHVGGVRSEIRHAAVHEFSEPFSLKALSDRFPGVEKTLLQQCIKALRDEGKLHALGRGRGVLYARSAQD